MEISTFIVFVVGAFLFVEGKAAKCEKKIDLAVVLDASASIGEENFNLAKQFIKKLSRRFSINKDKTRVSLVSYSQYINIKPKFNEFYDQKAIEERLDTTTLEGGYTGTGKTLTAVAFEVFSDKSGARRRRPGVKEATVVITDGYSTIGIETIKERTDRLKKAGVQMYSVGITGRMKDAELRVMASQPTHRHFFKLTDSKNIKTIVDHIVRDLCK